MAMDFTNPFSHDTITLLMAGGQGERLYPLTRDRAKPAVPFGGCYRIIDFTLSNCLNSGLRRIFVLTQYKSLSLEKHLRRGWSMFSEALGEFVASIPPQQRVGASWYQGTADAIYQNIYTLERERPHRVLILSGDHIYKMDYGKMLAFHGEKQADLTIACIEVAREKAKDLGVAGVDGDGRIVRFQEKSPEPMTLPGSDDRCLASMGIYIFNTDTLVRRVSQDAKRNTAHDFGKNVIPDMIGRDRVFAYPFEDENRKDRTYWRDIGRIDAYWEANMDLVSVDPDFNLYDSRWPVWTYMEQAPPVKTVFADEGERMGQAVDSLVSAGTIISGGRVENSILSHYVRVHSYSHVSESILMEGVTIGRHARVRRAIVDKGVTIPPGEKIGFDLEADARRFTVTDNGIVVVPKEMSLETSGIQRVNVESLSKEQVP